MKSVRDPSSTLLGTLCLGALLAGPSAAQEGRPPSSQKPGPSGSFAVVGARLETGDGTVLPEATVVVQDGVVRRVTAGKKAPAGLPVVDGAGKVLTPGLFETRTQLGVAEVLLEDASVDVEAAAPRRGSTIEAGLRPAFRVADGFNPASSRIAIERRGGVTHAIVSPAGGILAGQGAVFSLRGWPEEVRSTSVAGAPTAAEPVAMFGSVDADAAKAVGGSRGGLWLALRDAVLDTLAYRKSPASYDRGSTRDLSLRKADLEAMLPVVDGRLPLVLSADRASDILAALRFADEMRAEGARLRVVIAGGAEAWRVRRVLAALKMPVILTPSGQTPHSFDAVHARDDNAALLHEAGVPVILSTFNWDNNVRRLRQEAGIAVSWGLPREAALASITSVPAEVFGLAELGLIAPGKPAHLVLWDGDPLEVRTLPTHLWIDGEARSLESRQTQLAKKYGAGTR